MGRPERPMSQTLEPVFAPERADRGDLKHLLLRQRGKQGWQATGQQALAAAGGENRERGAAGEQVGDDGFLAGAKRVEAKALAQDFAGKGSGGRFHERAGQGRR
mgnify:CR=1 FL=1